jgi:hypothetical protein
MKDLLLAKNGSTYKQHNIVLSSFPNYKIYEIDTQQRWTELGHFHLGGGGNM